MNKLVFVVTLVSVLSAHSGAQETHWTLDKAHSQVKFTVQHLVISELTGRFKEFDATFKTIGDDIGTASVEAVIKTASIDTDNERRDTHLRSDDFLNVEKFPEMKFKSTSVENAGNNTYRIKGDLTIRDITRPVVLDTKYSGFVKTPWGGEVVAFKASVTINRFDFGTKWSKALETGGLIAGENVDVTLVMEFTKQKQQ